MTKLAIMTKNMDAYYHPPTDAYNLSDSYDRDKKYITNPESTIYGAKLITIKDVKIGYKLTIRFWWKHWQWKPEFSWKWNRSFTWLGFHIYLNTELEEQPDKVIRDFVGESK